MWRILLLAVPFFVSKAIFLWGGISEAMRFRHSVGALCQRSRFFATADDCLVAAMQSSAVQCSSSLRRWHIAAVGGRLRPTKTY